MACQDNGYRVQSTAEQHEKLQITTRLACEYCVSLLEQDLPIPDFAQKWWEQHVIEDEERALREKEQKIRERIKKEALAKLTNEERQSLGL